MSRKIETVFASPCFRDYNRVWVIFMLNKLPLHFLSMDQLQISHPLPSQCHRIFWSILLKWRLFQRHFLWDVFIFLITIFSIYVGLCLTEFLRLHIHRILSGSNAQLLGSAVSGVALHRFNENFSDRIYSCHSTSFLFLLICFIPWLSTVLKCIQDSEGIHSHKHCLHITWKTDFVYQPHSKVEI